MSMVEMNNASTRNEVGMAEATSSKRVEVMATNIQLVAQLRFSYGYWEVDLWGLPGVLQRA